MYYSTDESNEDTNSNSEQVLSASSTKAFLWSSKLKVKLCLLKNIDRMSIEICKVNKLQLYNTLE
jgi:hypothetical protein